MRFMPILNFSNLNIFQWNNPTRFFISSILKVIKTIVVENEPSSLPTLVASACNNFIVLNKNYKLRTRLLGQTIYLLSPSSQQRDRVKIDSFIIYIISLLYLMLDKFTRANKKNLFKDSINTCHRKFRMFRLLSPLFLNFYFVKISRHLYKLFSFFIVLET